MQYVLFWVFPRRLSANSRRFGTLYRFHLQRQVYEVWRGLGCVAYLYRTGFRQVGGGANGKVSSRLAVVRRGEVYKACAGGITNIIQWSHPHTPYIPPPSWPPPTGYSPSHWLRHQPAWTRSGINTPHIPNPVILHRPAFEDGTDRVFRNVGY
jgi:hypothetical protein